jgi:hypothetical protein
MAHSSAATCLGALHLYLTLEGGTVSDAWPLATRAGHTKPTEYSRFILGRPSWNP